MKRTLHPSPLSRARGFTLVELLVVITIIGILASIILYAGNLAIKSAKRAQAANLGVQLETAALGYYTEYSVYPDDTTAFPAGTDYVIKDNDAANWGNMLVALSGNINPANGQPTASTISNTRNISFLTMKASDVYSTTVIAPKNPLPPDTTHLYFNMAIDNDYNGVIGLAGVLTLPNFNGTFSASGGGTCTAGVAVWANCNGTANTTNPNWYVHTY